MKNLIGILVISVMLAVTAGCNTLAGLGEDAKVVVGKIKGTDKADKTETDKPVVEAADSPAK